MRKFAMFCVFALCAASSAQTASMGSLSSLQSRGFGTTVSKLTSVTATSLQSSSNDLASLITAAYNAAPGQTVYVPMGTYTLTSPIRLDLLPNATIDFQASTIVPSKAGFAVFTGDTTYSSRAITNVTLRNFNIAASSEGTKFTGVMHESVSTANPINGLTFSGCSIRATSSAGIEIVGLIGHADQTAAELQNITISGCKISSTGGPNLQIQNVVGASLQGNTLSTPSLIGPASNTEEPDNVLVSGDHIKVQGNDISGTPYWNLIPFGTNPPAAAIYAAANDLTISGNVIHDSLCTYELCVGHGINAPLAAVTMAFGGTAANYVNGLLVDGIHADSSQDVQIFGNTVSNYNTGITCEISHNCRVFSNSVSQIFGTAFRDDSRYDLQLVNPMTSVSGLTAGFGVMLGTTTSVKCTLGARGKGTTTCVTASMPAGFKGTIYSQAATAGSSFSAGALYPSFAALGCSVAQNAGDVSLVLSPTTSVSDPGAVVLPLPACDPSASAQRVFLHVPSIEVMNHLVPAGINGTGFESYALVVNNPNNSPVTMTIGSFGLPLQSLNDTWTGNTATNVSQGFSINGCGQQTVFSGNTWTNAGTYSDSANALYAYWGSIGVQSDSKANCARLNTTLTQNSVNNNRSLGSGDFYAAVGVDSSDMQGNSITADLISGLSMTNNTFGGVQGAHLIWSHLTGFPSLTPYVLPASLAPNTGIPQ